LRKRSVRIYLYGASMTGTRDVQQRVEPAEPVQCDEPMERVVDPPWEPPIAGTEVEHLSAALDRLRTTFRWKAGGLDGDELRAHVGSSSLTLGALLKHLAFVEDYYFSTKLRGESPGPPWETVDWQAHPEWPFETAGDDTPDELYALWDGAVERSRTRFTAALDQGGLDQLVEEAWPNGGRASLRRAVFDLVEEYGRHTGHADLIRESIDGLVGEDPPADWRP
jgi:hypothetical protein